MMQRNVRGFMSLFHSDKPVVCKVHGFCVAGGTDMALCSDLLIIEDQAKIGYPPARVWGRAPPPRCGPIASASRRPKRLLFTGDCLSGTEAVAWGARLGVGPRARSSIRAFEVLLERIARVPVNQLVMMKLLVNQTVLGAGLATTQLLGTVFDGHRPPYARGLRVFVRARGEAGFQASGGARRDEPFGDFGLSTFKG